MPAAGSEIATRLNRVLGDVEALFNDIGGTVGDVAGDVVRPPARWHIPHPELSDGITTLCEFGGRP